MKQEWSLPALSKQAENVPILKIVSWVAQRVIKLTPK
jgi:hypothetical protein